MDWENKGDTNEGRDDDDDQLRGGLITGLR